MKTRHFQGGLQRSQRGLTLVELMIGMVLGLIILSAMASVFVGSSTNYRQLDAASAVQEAGRISLERLNRDIRMTGNPGCGSASFLQHLSPSFSNDLALASAPGASATNPDGITLLRGSAEFAVVSSSPALDQVDLVSMGGLGAVAVGDSLLLSDCASTDVMVVTAVAGNSITGNGLSKQFRPGSQVMRLETVNYNVVGGELMRNGQAIASGVTNLKFLYGVAGLAGRSVTQYISAPSAAELSNTVAVKLLLAIADGRPVVTQQFNSTIALRNRAP